MRTLLRNRSEVRHRSLPVCSFAALKMFFSSLLYTLVFVLVSYELNTHAATFG